MLFYCISINIRKEIFQLMLMCNYAYRAIFLKTKLKDTISSKNGIFCFLFHDNMGIDLH